MFYRLFTVTIIVFWVTMTVLLVRKELGPGDLSLHEVPLAHVAKNMFAHEQASELQLYNEKLAVGHMRIHPRVRKQDGMRKVDFTGSLLLAFPGMSRQRVAWTGDLELNAELQAQKFKIGFSFREPASYTVDITLDPQKQEVTYESRAGGTLLKRGQYTLDEKGANDWLREQGIDPSLLMGLQSTNAAPSVKALQSSLQVHGEKIETWMISLEQGGQTMIEAHISQLGQILRVRTFAGYSAAPEDLIP